jgi:hypothetical protein
MSNDNEGEYTFVCPECAETLEVNGPMKEVLIEKGCVICGATVSAEAFTSTTPPGVT